MSETLYVSRGGLKLAAALDAFKLDVAGFTCTDLGCNVGGFTDCLLQRGAVKVYAVDTGYGTLAWKLRTDPRVVVMERVNAIHAAKPPLDDAQDKPATVDLVVIDLGWTKQKHAIPAALGWSPKQIITLIKPQYEACGSHKGGILTEADALRVTDEVLASLPGLGVEVAGSIQSPIRGGAGRGKSGNVEFLAHLLPLPGEKVR